MKKAMKLSVVSKAPKALFPIEHKKPIPPIQFNYRPGLKRQTPYAKYFTFFEGLQLFDCFVVGNDESTIKAVRAAATAWGKRNNVSFIFRRVDGVVKVWRVS